MLGEFDLGAVLQELQSFPPRHVHIDGVKIGVHCETSIAGEPEDVVRTVVDIVGDRRMVTHLFEEVLGAVGGLRLECFAKNRIQRLVPVVRRFEVADAPRHHEFHPLDRVRGEGSEGVEVRTASSHRRDSLQDAVMVHSFDRQAHRRQIEVTFHDFGADFAN